MKYLILFTFSWALLSCTSSNGSNQQLNNGVDSIPITGATIAPWHGKSSTAPATLAPKTLALSITSGQVTTMISNAINPLNTKITTLTNQNTAQDKTIVTLQAQLKAYSIDSAATKKRLSDAEKALLAKDTQFTNLNKNYMVLFDQHSTLYSRTDSLNRRLYDAATKTLLISKSLDSLGALVDSVKVYTDPKIFVFNGNVMTVPLLNQLAAQIKLIIDRLKILGISL